jgi:hypothetical protein
LNVVGTDLRRRRAADEVWRGIPQGVPGNVQSALHDLTTYLRQATARLDDGSYQTGADDRAALHLLDVVRVDRPDTSGVIAVGEPAVLQPAQAYQVGGFVEQAANVIKLGKPRTGLVAELELACLSPPSPPAQVDFG